jgi:hypothetical protein
MVSLKRTQGQSQINRQEKKRTNKGNAMKGNASFLFNRVAAARTQLQ